MYLHRYLRLAPLLCVAILVYMKLFPLLVDGPLDNGYVEMNNNCEQTWFWTLLFVQNYATMDIVSLTEIFQCHVGLIPLGNSLSL